MGKQEAPAQEKYAAPAKSDIQVKETVSSTGTVNVLDRKIVSTASLMMEVKSVEKAFNEITKIVQASGGYISSSSTYDSGGRKTGEMTTRFPQKNFYS